MCTPVALLVRVSTSRQETSRQVAELQQHADAQGWQVVAVLKETVSGRADESRRDGLQRVLELARAGKIRKVLTAEVSRIARRNSTVHSFIERLEDLGVSLYWHSQRVETLLPSGKRNPAAGIMLALLAEMARAEVELLRERINSGLAEARRQGKRLGRPPGSTLPTEKLLEAHRDVVKLLRAGQSVRHAAAISGKAASTVQRIAKLMKAPSLP